MSYPCLEIVCGNCGNTINRMINLKSIRDSIRPFSGRCNKCGISLNPTDFSLNTVKQWIVLLVKNILFYYVISKKSNNMLLLLYSNIIYNYSNDVTYY